MKMTEINLKEQLHEGCTVHFRCGGSAVVESVDTLNGDKTYCHGIAWKDCHSSYPFHESERYADAGHIHGSAVNHPFDIVKIDPKPFDWNDVKQGMAFKGLAGELFYYIGVDLRDRSYAVVGCDKSFHEPLTYHKTNLTRYPEGDLK